MLNIYGLFAQNEMPVVALLNRYHVHPESVDYREVAEKQFRREEMQGKTYDAIMVVIGADAAQVFVFK